MKTSLKKFTSLVLAVMMLISVMTAAGISVSAATTDESATGADVVYLDLSAVTTTDGEAFFVWKWGSTADAWYSLDYDAASGYYTTTMAANDGFVLVRMPAGSTTGDWSTMYNQSVDFKYDGMNNLAVVTFSDTYGDKMPISVGKYSGGQVVPTETTIPPTIVPPTVPTTKPTEPTEPSEQTDPDELQNLYVVATSNLGERALVKTEGTKTAVTYKLTAAELIDGGAFTVTYDTSKLTLDSSYTSAQMFPVVSDATYNLSAGTGVVMVNFTNAANKYDFTNGAVLVTLVFNEREGKTGRAAVNLEVTDLYSANTDYVVDGGIYNDSAVVTAAVADTSAEPGEEPSNPVNTDKNTNVTVRAYSNINTEIQEYNVTGSYIKVTYYLTAAELIAYGNGAVSFDENVLALEAVYNGQNTMFTTISDYVTYNLAVAPGVMEFAFSGINSSTQTGLYDFRNEAQLITLYFTVKAGSTGSTTVKLDMENLGSTGKDYVADYGVAAGVSGKVVAETTDTPATVPTQPSQPTQPKPTTPSSNPTNPTTPSSNPTNPTTPSSNPTNPTTPTTPTSKPTQPTTAAKKPYLNKTNVSLKAGDTVNLKVMDNVSGAKVKFSVSNSNIIKVSNKGKVTACSKGSAYVYATVGSEVLSCRVKVTTNPKLTNTKGKKISKVTIGVGGKTTKILISGKAAKLKNQYKSTAYVKVTGGKQKPFIKIKGLKAGKSTIQVKVNRSKTLKLKVTVK